MGRTLAGCLLLGLVMTVAASAADVVLEDFESLTAGQLEQRTTALGTGVQASLIPTDERAGKRNLLLTADLDPGKPTWSGVRLSFAARSERPQTLTFWYRGDRATDLYFVLIDSDGQRGDFQIGHEARAGEWQQAILPLKTLHVPNGAPPNDQMTPTDVAALEIYPAPGTQPAKGVYHYQIDDLSVACEPATPNAAPDAALMNPVVNASFSQLSADGQGFTDWHFGTSRNALCSLSVDPRGGRGGSPAALFHNESPVSPNVYGRVTQRVAVLPNMAYKLAFWCKGERADGGDHWTDWKTYRVNVPAGTFDWVRRETDFTTAPDQTAVELGLNLCNVIGKLWIDDVSLVPDYTEARAAGGRLLLWAPRTLHADKDDLTFRVGWLDLPQTAVMVRLRVVAADQTLGSAEVKMTALSAEFVDHLKVTPAPERAGTVIAEVLDAQGQALLTARREVDLLSDRYARQRLERLKTQLDALRSKMQQWRQRGLPTDYPAVTETVVDNFLPWVAEDLDHGELERAVQQIGELDQILRDALAQCDSPPSLTALRVPRYTGGAIRIDGGHFATEVKWPDGKRETRPVFFNGYGHFGAVRRDVEKFPAYGLNILQVEFGPSSVVQPDLSVNLDTVHEFVKLLDRAQQAGVAVNLLLSPHYMPGWVFQQHPEVGGVNGGFIGYDIDAPPTRQVIETFLKAVIPVLRGHPALHSLCLSNEPTYGGAAGSAHNREKWHAWLRATHGDIAALNGLWGTTYASFEDVPVPVASDLQPGPALYDAVRFNNARFAGWHRWMADIIHGIAPEIPVHAKIMLLAFDRNTLNLGNDVEQFCDLSQIAGNDASNSYSDDDSAPYANQWRGECQWYDLLRSMRGQPVFNSENHVVADRNWRPVPGMHMRSLLWEGAQHGLGASTTWVWERTYDNKSDFAGSIMHRPAMCDAHGRTALDLMRLAPEVTALQDRPARVALIYSLATQVYNPRAMSELGAAYECLTYMGEKVDFVTADQLAAGVAGKYRVIVAPGTTHLETPAFRALEAFARKAGCTLLTIGPGPLAADEYNRPRSTQGLRLTSLPASPEAATLRAALTKALGGDFPVGLLDAATGKPAEGVGWGWRRDGGRWLVDVCNYTRQPVRLRLTCPGARQLTNLFTGSPMTATFALGMMEPALIEAR